jgi:hypothetical protein
MEDERRKAEGVVAMEVSQEDDLDVGRSNAHPRHVGKQRGARIEQHLAIDDDRAVVSLGGEGRPRAEK